MVRLAVVEDDPGTMRQMCAYMAQYDREQGTHHQVTSFYDGDEILDEYESVYDAVLLDIQMKRIDGLRTARKIREKDENVVLVFVTNMANYAIKGYEVNAYDFVLKPVTYFSISKILEKIDKLMERHRQDLLSIPTAEGMMQLRTKEIVYFESFDHRVQMSTVHGKIWVRLLMRELEERLKEHGFYRCSNSYLINLAYVECINKNSVRLAGQEFPVSRAKKKEFLEIFTMYMGTKAYE